MKLSITLLCLVFSIAGISQKTVNVYFESNKYDLSDAEKTKLDSISKKSTVLSISGFTDSQGSVEANQILSDSRVKIVTDYLKQAGYPFSNNFGSKSVGEEQSSVEIVSSDRKVTVVFGTEPPKVEIAADVSTAKVGEKVKLDNMNFVPGSAKMLGKSVPVAKKLLEKLKANPKLKIDIQGHICCIAPDGPYKTLYVDLSSERAKTVYDYLVKNGIDKNRLSYKGLGASRPIHPVPERNDQEQIENRRVEIEIIAN